METVKKAPNVMPQIILNQPGADLINKLLDAVLKGGGLSNLTLVKEVLTVTNYRPDPPQEETPKEPVKQVPTEFSNRNSGKKEDGNKKKC